MPEGHTVHRLARALAELYGGQRLAASSPQGRFSAGARRINDQVLLDTSAHGKHLFAAFGPQTDMSVQDDSVTWLRVHLGLYGSWTFAGDETFVAPHAIGAPRRRVGERGEQPLAPAPAAAAPPAGAPTQEWQPPEPRGAVRLRLVGEHGVADLTGPAACELLDAAGVAAVRRRLGPDPLDPAADPRAFIDGARRRRTPVGELVMDQSLVAGAGNIYRAEVLFRAGLSPFIPGRQVPEERLRLLWEDLVVLMGHGLATGRIVTVEADDVPDPLPQDDAEAGRWYVYHRAGRPCLRCGAVVSQTEAAGRRLFWCPACQAG
ncbi:MAG: DNA-formamidopyrimidine glycosylase family protein [Actinomyces sp.]|uniref:Fpg/Nei family DNA glycosylase n=1 Tax=Actinomyces sp. TaxID=29317 RepID=UPI0026DBB3BC|nr:DNA-formamidopyrimidine glycosylase family protein [Actinomyces sp.]MDO4243189.1 DNA-formamidopyrimidine glycosylase family protein [Actinomyces sp.]